MAIWWGASGIQLYNDGYRRVIGGKHPGSLAQSCFDCWQEIWHVVGPYTITYGRPANPRGPRTYRFLWSATAIEETYFTFSYSAIHDESGAICVSLSLGSRWQTGAANVRSWRSSRRSHCAYSHRSRLGKRVMAGTTTPCDWCTREPSRLKAFTARAALLG
jgi:hypothetical protein